MKTFFTLIPIFLLYTMAFSQDNNTDSNPFDKLSWIADRWISMPGENMQGESIPGESITYENWVRLDDTAYTGESYTVKKGDIVFTEQLKIEKIGDDIFYTAIVEHNPAPVHFKLVELDLNKAVFENPEHDFPNRIIYMLKKDGSLYARIEGRNKKGEEITGEFFYTRAR